MGQIVDIAGQRFGMLRVIEQSDKRTADRRVQWRCICDCGNETVKTGKHLRNGETSSCGCYGLNNLVLDLTGRVFGRLTVIERDTTKPTGSGAWWLCQCQCGNVKTVISAPLTKGLTISCGCAVKDQMGLMPAKARRQSAIIRQRRRARLRNAEGSFTEADIEELYRKQRGRCANCKCKVPFDKIARDHRKALALGGTNYAWNLEILCDSCNSRKWAKDEIAWAQENGRLL